MATYETYDASPPSSNTNEGVDPSARSEFSLGKPASGVYSSLMRQREDVWNMGRVLAELTIPSLVPPHGWRVGESLPGNNQSLGAKCVNNLAAKLTFMAFPPNQPIMKYVPIESELQGEITQDPALWGQIELSLGRLAEQHRQRFLATTLMSAYEIAMKHLLVAGNCLWKHIKLNSPTVWGLQSYVCKRASDGSPLLSIHKEEVSVETLAPDVKEMIYRETPEVQKKDLWEQEVCIYSVCRLCVEGPNPEDMCWEYWQEYNDKVIEGTQVETDYDDPPMIPLWMIPVYGQDWGLPFCFEYRGDLFSAEAIQSGINDGVAIAALSLLFVDPASRTSLRQIREARNLSAFAGKATDVTVFRSEKTADLNFVAASQVAVEKRLNAVFLVDFIIQRAGERVTAEEIKRLGAALDQALGGRYSELSQRSQRLILLRAVKLHEEENKSLPKVPSKTVQLQVITGLDAVGDNKEAQDLEEYGDVINRIFPQKAQQVLKPIGFATRLAAAKGIKPDGIVATQQEVDQQDAQQQQAAARSQLMDKATGPAVKGVMDGMLQNGLPQVPGGQQPQAPSGPDT